METKGAHLANEDTRYKQALMQRLTQAWRDERLSRAGELALEGGGQPELECDLVFDQGWRGTLDKRHFS